MCDDISSYVACRGYFLDGLVSIEEKQLKKIRLDPKAKCCNNAQLAQYSSRARS